MRWRRGRRSSNIEDRRGNNGGFRPRGGGVKIGGLGFFILIALFLFLGQGQNFFGGGGLNNNDSTITNRQTDSQRADPRVRNSQTRSQTTANSDPAKEFISVVLGTTEDVWTTIFRQSGLNYRAPKLVLFDDYVRSACGLTSSATGPFYCPGDSKVYIDLGFFRELARMGGNGDFAQAYVIAHEVAHHVQNLQGISMDVQRAQQRSSKKHANKLSVLTELQADCYAGVWAHHTEKKFRMLEEGDIEEAIKAAASIGDDRMQRRAGQWVNPDSFTHGSSKQRTQWLQIGLLSGDAGKCDTFKSLN